MVTKPQDYRWSSYHRNGLGNGNRIITPHDEYRRLGATDEVRRAAYRTLFRDHLDAALVAEIRQSTNGNFVLGGKRFQEQIAAALGRRVMPGEAGRPRAKDDKIDGRQRLLLQ